MPKKKYGVIYKITNLINGKIYIGQTTQEDPYKRIQFHFKRSEYKSLISDAIQKYGKENFIWEIILTCFTQNTLNEMEIYFINKYKSRFNENGYNIKFGGENGGKLPEESKRKIGNGIKKWYETHNHPFKGKEFSKEHKEALSKVRKGTYTEKQHNSRLESVKKSYIKVKATNIKTDEIYIFNSIKECADTLNLDRTCIGRVCNKRNNRTQHKGWKLEHYNE